MSRLLVLRRCFIGKRTMSTNPTNPPPPPPPPPATPASDYKSMSARYRPSNFEKTILVWTKKFKSKEEVPPFVSADLIEKSRSQARIKISNILIFLTALASFGAVLSGKAAAKRGESVHQMNLDWHKQYQDEEKARAALSPPK